MTTAVRNLRLSHFVALTFFIVSGGPFGLEDLLATLGAHRSLWVLAIVPLIWSLPTALLVGELAAALPHEGGYYAWVRRGLGRFWGVQEAWWSLAASIFDMAIYPTLFGLYLSRLHPLLAIHALALGLCLIAMVVLINLVGPRSVGDSSLVLFVLVIVPFAWLVLLPHSAATTVTPTSLDTKTLGLGLSVAMWNYMGWDNAATFAPAVEQPARTYPLGVFLALALVTLVYLLPVWGVAKSGVDTTQWTAGSWVDFAAAAVHPWLGRVIAIGGALSAAGMFNALVLSYSRLPLAMAEDGELPAFFAKKTAADAPVWVLLGLGLAYGCALGLGFRRLVELDVILYGLSLALEFAALIMLRVKEPELERPFRIKGGVPTLLVLSALPTALLVYAAYATLSAGALDMSIFIGVLVIGLLLSAYAKKPAREIEA